MPSSDIVRAQIEELVSDRAKLERTRAKKTSEAEAARREAERAANRRTIGHAR